MNASGAEAPRVVVVGGGLAGLAASAALLDSGVAVTLFEAKRRLGGRATSFEQRETGELVDHCQHVGMGCCTNLTDFARRVGIDHLFQRFETLHFIGPDGRQYDFRAAAGLPTPLGLMPALLRLGYLTWGEKLGIARTMIRLARLSERDLETLGNESIESWLRRNGQGEQAFRRFWAVVLVSALGESLDRAGVRYARKVFVDGFLAARDAYMIHVPSVPLGKLYGEKLELWLTARGGKVRKSSPVAGIDADDGSVTIRLSGGVVENFDAVVIAVAWRALPRLLASSSLRDLVAVRQAEQMKSSPITAVHLWFDRAITPLPHAVLIDRRSQWLFSRGTSSNDKATEHYYQVVISASYDVSGVPRDELVAEIVDELADVWPVVRVAKLCRSRVVTDNEAVFSATGDVDRRRPDQATEIPNVFLAGDWTNSGWPSTMEGAVRSGYLAAEQVLAHLGRPAKVVQPGLRRAPLTRLLIGRAPS